MVTFDHRDPGTREETWIGSELFNDLPRVDLESVRQLIVVSAHPDDETLGAGGLTARAAALGIDVAFIIATDGEGSHPRSPSHEPGSLAALRRDESRRAAAVLAPGATVTFVGIPDGAVTEHRDALTHVLKERICDDPSTLVLAPWTGDGHADHQAVAEAARESTAGTAIRLLEYPIWLWHWSDPGDGSVAWERLVRFDLAESEAEAKAEAVGLHASQILPLSERPGDEPVVSRAMVEHFARDFEVFFDYAQPRPAVADARKYFDGMYEHDDDPWGFETRWYEKRKRAVTVSALPRERFSSVLEVGCSTGVLTEELAARADRVLGIDIVDAAIARARDRFTAQPQVRIEKIEAPREWPGGRFELIVLSEVGYYLSLSDLELLLDKAIGSLTASGVILACHWRYPVADYPLTGDAVHAALNRRPELGTLVEHREDDFILNVYARRPARSVAVSTGLV